MRHDDIPGIIKIRKYLGLSFLKGKSRADQSSVKSPALTKKNTSLGFEVRVTTFKKSGLNTRTHWRSLSVVWRRENTRIVSLDDVALIGLSCKIIVPEPLGFTSRIQQLSSQNSDPLHSKSATLAPKLTDPLSPLESWLHPFYYWIKYSWSGSTHILYYINLSVVRLGNQISLCQHIFYYRLIPIYVSWPKVAVASKAGIFVAQNCWQFGQGILKGEVSLYHWPPVLLVWISLFCK